MGCAKLGKGGHRGCRHEMIRFWLLKNVDMHASARHQTMLCWQARIAGAIGAHVASSTGAGTGEQSGRGTSDGGGGLQEQCAAEMAQVAPQLRALRIDSEAGLVGGQSGIMRSGHSSATTRVRGLCAGPSSEYTSPLRQSFCR